MRVAFWNLNVRTNQVAIREKAALLADVGADVVLVAECDPPTFTTLVESFGSGGHAFGLEGSPPAERAMGCGVLVPNGVLQTARTVAELPRPERGVLATVEVEGRPVDVLAWHAPHAVGEGPDRMATKMAAYRAVIDLWAQHPGPLVVGCDMNSPWFDPWEPAAPMRPTDDPFHDDDRIFGPHQATGSRTPGASISTPTPNDASGSGDSGPKDLSLSRTTAGCRD